jgi:exopolysaccharide production protein ExoZ
MAAVPIDLVPAAQRYNTIQALRFVAALLVLITHSTFYTSDRLDHSLGVWGGGTVGVDIFFVISGFVMMVTSPPFQAIKAGWRYFAMRRVVRIVPMYWIATTVKILTVLVLPSAAINSVLDPQHVLFSYVFLPSRNQQGQVLPILGVGWTLTFEMLFYAIFTVGLLIRANPYIFASALLLLAAAGHGVRLLLAGTPYALRIGSDPVWTYYLDKVVLYFVIGMTIAKVVSSARLRRYIPHMLVGLCAIAVGLGAFGALDWSRSAWFRTVVVTIIVLAAVSLEGRIGARLPRPVLFMGDASYTLYLFHPLIAPLVPVVLAALGFKIAWISVVGSILVAIAASALIYILVERPITRRARRLPYAGKLPVTVAK